MTIVKENAKTYIYYHYYCFSNVQRSILKWYIIAIRMEIIFYRCGGAEVILMVAHPPFRTFFQLVSHHQFRTENAVPHRCAVRSCGRWYGSAHLCLQRYFFKFVFRKPHTAVKSLAVQWVARRVSRRFYVSIRSFTQWRHINVILVSFCGDETGVSMLPIFINVSCQL